MMDEFLDRRVLGVPGVPLGMKLRSRGQQECPGLDC
jgi:hypothetical protein